MKGILGPVSFRKDHHDIVLAISAITIFLVMISPLLSPLISAVIEPYWDAGECEECHGGFKPFKVIPDTPDEVIEGQDFKYKLILENPWSHEVRDIQITIDLQDAPSIMGAEDIEDETILEYFDCNIGAGASISWQFDVPIGAGEVLLQMYYVDPLLFTGDLNLEVEGPNGGSWNSDLSDTTEVIHIQQEEILDEGYGSYAWTLNSEATLRSVEYHLSITVTIPGGKLIITDVADIGSRGETTIEFDLVTQGRGDNEISYSVTGTAYHDHGEDHPDSDTYTIDGMSSINVGDEYSYRAPTSKMSRSETLWYIGRIMAFVTTVLFVLSFLSGGSIQPLKEWMDKQMKNRSRFHCNFSKLVLLAAIIHLAVLYAGYYSGTYKGIFLGGLSLVLMIVLAVTGALKKKISQRYSLKTWKRIHFWLSVIILVLIVIHAVKEGTDLAFLRFWE